MMRGFKYISITGLLLIIGAMSIQAQISLSLNDKSMMSVSGTSTLHDWHSDIETIKTSAEATFDEGKLTSIDKFLINVPVTSIKSGKKAMDKNTYEALKEEEHPIIKFQLISSEINGNEILTEGKLAIAGKVNTVQLTGNYALTSSTLTIEGKYDIDMNDFGIDPPTALMGTVTTGKDVTIHYNIIFNL